MLLGTSKPNKLSYISFNFWTIQANKTTIQEEYKNRHEWVVTVIHRTVQMIRT